MENGMTCRDFAFFPYPSITHHHHIMCFKSLPLLQQGQNIMLHVALSNHGKNNIGKAQGWPFKGSSKVAVQFYDFIADAVLQCIMHDSSLLWNVLIFLNKGWWPVSKLGSSKQPFFCGQSHSLNAVFISSVRSSSGYHGLIEIQRSKATFSNFSNSSDSKVKVKVKGPNMCYIFEKHWIQGYLIWHFRVSNVKYTNTRLHKYANTQIQSA